MVLNVAECFDSVFSSKFSILHSLESGTIWREEKTIALRLAGGATGGKGGAANRSERTSIFLVLPLARSERELVARRESDLISVLPSSSSLS